MTFPKLALTSPEKGGQDVADAQWLLSGHNRFKQTFYAGKKDATFGSLSAAASHRAKYWVGYPKSQIDGTFGPNLYSFLLPLDGKHPLARRLPLSYRIRRALRLKAAVKASVKPTLGQSVLAEAKKHLNYREAPTNRTTFGVWFGMDGNPWCAMFVSYCVAKLGGKFHYSFVPTVVADARASRNGLFTTNDPKPGDAVCFDWDNNGTFDHIGFFENWIDQAAGKFRSVEGNTLPEGGSGDQSNGGGVYERTSRGTKDGYGVVFVRYQK